jgi:hypothetical protein
VCDFLQVLQHPWLTSELDTASSAQLASPVQLRSTLSKTERGRQLLALAAMAYSEGDLRNLRSNAAATANSAAAVSRTMAVSRKSEWAFCPAGTCWLAFCTAGARVMLLAAAHAASVPKALLPLPVPCLSLRPLLAVRQTVGCPPMSAAAEALDYDLQPVRDQAGNGTSSKRGARGAAATAAGEGREDDGVAAAIARLRAQLDIVGTAGGLQDRRSLEQQGQPLLPASPRAPAAGGGGARSGAAALDGFADLGALEVEEKELSDDEGSASSLSRAASGQGMRQAWPGPAAAAPLAPLHLHLPPAQQLPEDQQLLEQLLVGPSTRLEPVAEHGHAQGGSARAAAAGAAGLSSGRQRGMKRVQSARQPGEHMVRSTSTSQLSAKELRYEQSEREPVDLAMQQKVQRLAGLSVGAAPQLPQGDGAQSGTQSQRRLHRILTFG